MDALPPKHRKQIKACILKLQKQLIPNDAKCLIGYKPYLRVDCGEYRVIYKFDSEEKLVTVVLVGKRNDGHVYRRLQSMSRSL
jgi:mRNA interferase RelE/StbE